jgi:hypothetical protein
LIQLKVSLINLVKLVKEYPKINSNMDKRNLKAKWHGKKSTLPPFLRIGIGETLATLTMFHGLSINIFLSTAAHAGLKARQAHSPTDSTF